MSITRLFSSLKRLVSRGSKPVVDGHPPIPYSKAVTVTEKPRRDIAANRVYYRASLLGLKASKRKGQRVIITDRAGNVVWSAATWATAEKWLDREFLNLGVAPIRKGKRARRVA